MADDFLDDILNDLKDDNNLNLLEPDVGFSSPSSSKVGNLSGLLSKPQLTTSTLQWNDLKTYLNDKREDKFIRSESTQKLCDNYYIRLIKEYGFTNVKYGILVELFGENNKLPEYIMIPNKFAFNIDNNINQYLLFLNKKPNISIDDLIKQNLSKIYTNYEYLFCTFSSDFVVTYYPFYREFTSKLMFVFVKQTAASPTPSKKDADPDTKMNIQKSLFDNLSDNLIQNDNVSSDNISAFFKWTDLVEFDSDSLIFDICDADDDDNSNVYKHFKASSQIDTFKAIKQFIKKTQKPKVVYPQIEECIIWSELEEIIEEEWIHKLWRNDEENEKYSDHIKSIPNYTQYILKKEGFNDDINKVASVSLFEYPFTFFGGITHFIIYSKIDWMKTYKKKKKIADILYNNYLIKNDLIRNKQKDKWLYFEERSLLPILKQTNSCILSNILDSNVFPNIYHVFVQDFNDYYGDITGPLTNVIPQPLLYDQIRYYSDTLQLQKIGRDEKWMRKYLNDKKKSKQKPKKNDKPKPKFKSIKDKILINEFNIDSKLNPSTNRLEAQIDDKIFHSFFYARNFYPYWFYKGIKHNLCWYLMDKKKADNLVEAFIESSLPDGYTYTYWENPPELRSIPDFSHYQVLSINSSEYWRGIGNFKIIRGFGDDFNKNQCYKWNYFVNNSSILETIKFGRSERICRKYYKQLTENLQIFNSDKDIILRRVFGYDIILNKNINKLLSVNIYNNNNTNYRFIRNKYPYFLDSKLKQYILFCTDISGLNYNKINEIISDNIGTDQYIYWIPNKINKSIKDIWYCHIIAKKKDICKFVAVD